jgi:YidC/Oxa1 family membrane protein insertase
MDKRTLLALALMALVIVLTPRLFPSKRPTVAAQDSAAVVSGALSDSATRTAAASTSAPPTADTAKAPAAQPPSSARRDTTARETVMLTTPRAEYSLVNPGAVPQAVRISSYKDLRPGRATNATGVTITDGRGPLLGYRVARGADTIQLDTVRFAVSKQGSTVTFTSPVMTLSYEPTSDGYRTAVRGTVVGAGPGAALLVDLPTTIRSVEADTLDDTRHLAFGYKLPLRDVTSVPFAKLDAGAVRPDTGSFQWVSARSKYWLVALMQPVGGKPAGIFRGIVMRGGPRVGKIPNLAEATTSLPLSNGSFAFDLYIGPQSWQELHALGNDLENVNPYAGWFHAIVQPFATIMMRVLLWMRATLRVNYGWVLVLFGVGIRLLLWPLNQKAMRTSIQMQRLQPELTEIQKRYKDNPEKQREALVRVYADHGMSPFSPMLGCVPMLLPMPVLFALYFVFQNTIEFRGVSFLWLPDISLRDPLYIIPIVMGASMFLLSWIGMRASPPNPQAKVMSYMMPVMFMVMFLNFASGLNLYYAAQNIAALPQQWVLTRERVRAGVTQTASTNPASRSRKT